MKAQLIVAIIVNFWNFPSLFYGIKMDIFCIFPIFYFLRKHIYTGTLFTFYCAHTEATQSQYMCDNDDTSLD